MPVPLFFTQALQAVDLPSERLALDPLASADPEYAHEFGHALAVIGQWARTPEPAWRRTWAAEELRAVLASLSGEPAPHRRHGKTLNQALAPLNDAIKALVAPLPKGAPLFISAWQDGVTPLVTLTTALPAAPPEPWLEMRGAEIVYLPDEEMPVEDGEPGETVTVAGGWDVVRRERGSTAPRVYLALACFGPPPQAPPEDDTHLLGIELEPVNGQSASEALAVLFGLDPHNAAVRVSRGRATPLRKDGRR